jgi:hypothetical protein
MRLKSPTDVLSCFFKGETKSTPKKQQMLGYAFLQKNAKQIKNPPHQCALEVITSMREVRVIDKNGVTTKTSDDSNANNGIGRRFWSKGGAA